MGNVIFVKDNEEARKVVSALESVGIKPKENYFSEGIIDLSKNFIYIDDGYISMTGNSFSYATASKGCGYRPLDAGIVIGDPMCVEGAKKVEAKILPMEFIRYIAEIEGIVGRLNEIRKFLELYDTSKK